MRIYILMCALFCSHIACADVVVESGEYYQQSTSSSLDIGDLTVYPGGTILARGDSKVSRFTGGTYTIYGGQIDGKIELGYGTDLSIQGGDFLEETKLDLINGISEISGGNFLNALYVWRLKGTLTISGGTFHNSVGILTTQGDLVISGGEFLGGLYGTTSYTSGAQPKLTVVGDSFTLNDEAITLTNGQAILGTADKGTLRGTLADGNPFVIGVGYGYKPATITLRKSNYNPPPPSNVDLNGTVTGLNSINVICYNLTDNTSVSAQVNAAQPWDCKALGLIYRQGDQIKVELRGSAD